MQIILSTNLPNSSGETTAKSNEPGNDASAGAFFAQMGHLWNPDNETSDSQPVEMPVAQNQGAMCMDQLIALIGAAIPSPNPIEMEPVPNPGPADSTSSASPDTDVASANTLATIPAGTVGRNLDALLYPAGTESIRDQEKNEIKDSPNTALQPSLPLMSSISPPNEVSAESKVADGEILRIVEEANQIKLAMPDSGEGITQPRQHTGPPDPQGPNPISEPSVESPIQKNGVAGSNPGVRTPVLKDGVADGNPGMENGFLANEIAGNNPGLEASYPEDGIVASQQRKELPLEISLSIPEAAPAELQPKLPNINPKSIQPQKTIPSQDESTAPIIRNPFPDLGTELVDSSNADNSSILRNADNGNEGHPVLLNQRKSQVMPSTETEPNDAGKHPVAQEALHSESVLQKILQSSIVAAAKEAPASPGIMAEPRQELPSGLAWKVMTEENGSAEPSLLSRESKTQDTGWPPAILRRFEPGAQTTSDNSNAGGSKENQDQMQEASVPRSVLQAKTENGQSMAFGKIQVSNAERPNVIQAVLTSNPMRLAESINLAFVPPATPSTPQPRELVLQLADQLQIQLRDGKEVIRIQLNPDTLGRIEIRAQNTLHGVTAQITTESGSVKSYLENNLQFLQQTLNDQGLRVDRINVIVQDALDTQSSSGHSAQFGHAGSGRSGKEPDAASKASGPYIANPSDEMPVEPVNWLRLNPNSRFYTVA